MSLPHNQPVNMQSAKMTIWILWAAMVVSVCIYAVVILVLGDQIHGAGGNDPDIQKSLTRIFSILSGLILILAMVLRRRFLDQQPTDPRTGMKEPFEPGPYMTNMLICLALCEVIGIFGLILFMFGAATVLACSFIFVSAVAMLFIRPNRAHFETGI